MISEQERAALYHKETMREVAHSFGRTDAEFEKAWADFDANRKDSNQRLVMLELALIARRP